MNMKVYDATGMIIGRLSTRIAKDLLNGETIRVVNCEKSVISGNPIFTKKQYLERRQKGDRYHGPFFPRTPQGIVRRTIRGMVSHHKPRGREAFRKLRVYVGVPDEFKNKSFLRVEEADVNRLRCKHITVEDLSLYLGTKKRW